MAVSCRIAGLTAVTLCGCLATQDGFDAVQRSQTNGPPGPKAVEELVVAHDLQSKRPGRLPRRGKVVVDLAQEPGGGIHGESLGYLSPVVKGKYLPQPNAAHLVNYPTMFRQIIEAGLRAKGLSKREASLLCDMNETWVKTITRAKDPIHPTAAPLKRLADLLEIDPVRLLGAVAEQFPGKTTRGSLQTASRILAQMSPKDRAAFIAAHKTTKQ